MTPDEHEGVTGVTFDSAGHRLRTDDAWVPVEHARRLRPAAGQPCRYVEADGASHAFAWHRGVLADLVTGWLDEVSSSEEGER